MARSTKYSDKLNNADFEGNQELTAAERDRLEQFPGLGYYARTNLEDIINNFMVSHVGEGKLLRMVPRHEIAFWAQRGTQEFSYDILTSEKNIEIELSESLSIPLPNDYVNYVRVSWVDGSGFDRTIHPDRRANAKQPLLQDDEFNLLYDADGNRTEASQSETIERFQDPNVQGRELRQNSFSNFSDDIYDQYYSGYFGRRYGNDPQFENYNGTFVLDHDKGIIYFGSTFQSTDVISLRYISDGLCDNEDLSKVFFPKLAEDAMYSYILYNLLKTRTQTAQIAPAYKKEAFAKMRNAKLRLSNYKTEEIAQVMRGRAKWIKH